VNVEPCRGVLVTVIVAAPSRNELPADRKTRRCLPPYWRVVDWAACAKASSRLSLQALEGRDRDCRFTVYFTLSPEQNDGPAVPQSAP